MIQSPLDLQMMQSSLGQLSQVRPKGKQRKKNLAITLVLTSLVDAFCMLVIYLMFNVSPNDQTAALANHAAQLPIALTGETLQGGVEAGTTVRVQNGQFLLNDRPVDVQQMAGEFQKLAQNLGHPPELLIQADKTIDFATFNPIFLAAAEAHIHRFKFAVFKGDLR